MKCNHCGSDDLVSDIGGDFECCECGTICCFDGPDDDDQVLDQIDAGRMFWLADGGDQ